MDGQDYNIQSLVGEWVFKSSLAVVMDIYANRVLFITSAKEGMFWMFPYVCLLAGFLKNYDTIQWHLVEAQPCYHVAI